MKERYSPSEIVDLGDPDMPTTVRGVNKMAADQGWRDRVDAAGEALARRREGQGGGFDYSYRLFPHTTQARMVKREATLRQAQGEESVKGKKGDPGWAHFERLGAAKQAKARERLAVLEAVKALQRGGLTKDQAVASAAGKFKVGASTVYTWFDAVRGIDRQNWLPHLAPRHAGANREAAACDPRCWEALKADYLRVEKPSFETCYRRVDAIASAQGWIISSARTLRRRIEREIPAAVNVLCREGVDAVKRLYPYQERDRTMFHALEAVNADGHKWDVFVRWPDGTIGRPMMVAIQDLYSNKFLGWRVDRSENADAVRLAFADVFRKYGIPDLAWLDNGRGFASKWITGGQTTRYRFKIKAEDPVGLLTEVGCDVHWTKPYSGQSKPIERAFKDFCDAIAKHPAFAGAYTGNKPDAKPENYGNAAIPLADFIAVVEQGIRMHNAQPGRNTRVCQRRLSFDQAFEASYADAMIRKASPEQLRMFLLAAESVTADRRSGEVRLLGNRYWSECLHDHMGQKLMLRFDPDDLHAGVHVYRLDAGYVGFADCLEAAGFANTTEGRDHNRNRAQLLKSTRAAAALHKQMTLDQLVKLLPAVEDDEPPETRTVRMVVGNAVAKARVQTEAQEDENPLFMEKWSKGLRLVRPDQE